MDRSGRVDQPASLSELLGMEVHFWPTLERGGGSYGIALAATDPIEPSFHPLPRGGTEEPRGAITASFRACSIVATHLSPVISARRDQLRALLELANGLPGPVLLMGDLNCGRFELRPLIRAGFALAPRWRRTTDRGLPRQIDHVLAGRGARVAAARTIGGGASDHRLLTATVTPSGA
jgi:endonuclease/exonuclease/phosphatase family metal-dependent hydrolase